MTLLEETTLRLDLPMQVPLSAKRNFSLNLNQYRNAHHQTLSKAKVKFGEMVSPLVQTLPFFHRVRIHYTVFPRTRAEFDLANVVAVVDKFFCDVLVDQGRLPDDCHLYLLGTSSGFGGVDPDHPRVEASIKGSLRA